MNKPIISAVVISVACAVGFIFGFMFNEAYQPEKKDLVITTISQHSKITDILDTYTSIIRFKLILEELENTKSKNDIEALKYKYKKRPVSK